jgi:hypothetical protein
METKTISQVFSIIIMNENKKEFHRNWSLSDDMSEIELSYPLKSCKIVTTLTSDLIFFPKKLTDVQIKTEGGDIVSLLKELEEMRDLYMCELKNFNTIDLQCHYLWLELIDNIIELNSPNDSKLYIMQNQFGLIKIGRSKNPERRKMALQYQLGEEIQIIKILKHYNQEKSIHKVFHPFNAYHKGGIEWFSPYPELIKWVDEVDDDNFEKLYKKLCHKNLNTQKKKSLML